MSIEPANEPTHRRRWGLLLAALVALAVASIAFLRAIQHRHAVAESRRTHEREIREAIDLGQENYRRITMAPFRDFPTASSVRPHLANLALPPGDDLAAADNDTLRLINLTGDTIYFRLIQQSPEAYRAWRESSGYVFRDAAAMRRELVPQDYEFLFQESYPGDDHIVSVFDRLWTVARDRFNGAAMPVALPAEGTGLAIAFGQIEFGQEIRLPVLSGTLPGDVWMGRSQIGFRNWWSDPEGGAMQALQRHGRLRVALVGVILELQSGERYPFSFLYYQVPSGEWWLWRMNVLNTTPERGVMFEL